MFKELEAIKARVKEMEEEAEKLKEMQKQVEETIMSPPASQPACKMKHLLFSLQKFKYGTTSPSQPLYAFHGVKVRVDIVSLTAFFLGGRSVA